MTVSSSQNLSTIDARPLRGLGQGSFMVKKEKGERQNIKVCRHTSINTDLHVYIVSIIHNQALVIAFVSSGAIYCVKYSSLK